jgi:hypothetical protein
LEAVITVVCLHRPSFAPVGASIIFTAILVPRDQLQIIVVPSWRALIWSRLHLTLKSILHKFALNFIDTGYKLRCLLHMALTTKDPDSRPSVSLLCLNTFYINKVKSAFNFTSDGAKNSFLETMVKMNDLMYMTETSN